MSDISFTYTRISRAVSKIKWASLTSGTKGVAYDMPAGCYVMDVQILGTITATVALKGSNDGGVTYQTLKDKAGANIAATAAFYRRVDAAPLKVRPEAGATAGNTADVYLVIRLQD